MLLASTPDSLISKPNIPDLLSTIVNISEAAVTTSSSPFLRCGAQPRPNPVELAGRKKAKFGPEVARFLWTGEAVSWSRWVGQPQHEPTHQVAARQQVHFIDSVLVTAQRFVFVQDEPVVSSEVQVY